MFVSFLIRIPNPQSPIIVLARKTDGLQPAAWRAELLEQPSLDVRPRVHAPVQARQMRSEHQPVALLVRAPEAAGPRVSACTLNHAVAHQLAVLFRVLADVSDGALERFCNTMGL